MGSSRLRFVAAVPALAVLLSVGCEAPQEQALRQAQAMCKQFGGIAYVNFDNESDRLDKVKCKEGSSNGE